MRKHYLETSTRLVRVVTCGCNGMARRYRLTDVGELLLRRLRDVPNVRLCAVFGVGLYVVSKWRRERGLYISSMAYRRVHSEAALKNWQDLKKDPRCVEMLKARGRNLSASGCAARKRDAARLRMGLPQVSKFRLKAVDGKMNRSMRNARYYLRSHGYMTVDREIDFGQVVRYDDRTVRSEALEARYQKRFGWKFLPEGADEEYVKGRDDSPLEYGFTTKY